MARDILAEPSRHPRWRGSCWALFAVCLIAVALVVAHYSIGTP
jgi:hypothetical protein